MTFKAAIILGALAVTGAAGPLATTAASAAPVQSTVAQYNPNAYNPRRDADDARVSCPRILDALHHLNDAREAMGNVLVDYSRNDPEYAKLKEAERQIIDGIASANSRLQRNHCPG